MSETVLPELKSVLNVDFGMTGCSYKGYNRRFKVSANEYIHISYIAQSIKTQVQALTTLSEKEVSETTHEPPESLLSEHRRFTDTIDLALSAVFRRSTIIPGPQESQPVGVMDNFEQIVNERRKSRGQAPTYYLKRVGAVCIEYSALRAVGEFELVPAIVQEVVRPEEKWEALFIYRESLLHGEMAVVWLYKILELMQATSDWRTIKSAASRSTLGFLSAFAQLYRHHRYQQQHKNVMATLASKYPESLNNRQHGRDTYERHIRELLSKWLQVDLPA